MVTQPINTTNTPESEHVTAKTAVIYYTKDMLEQMGYVVDAGYDINTARHIVTVEEVMLAGDFNASKPQYQLPQKSEKVMPTKKCRLGVLLK